MSEKERCDGKNCPYHDALERVYYSIFGTDKHAWRFGCDYGRARRWQLSGAAFIWNT
jgi:hypothetical protein